jgi:hypothetical protein
LLANLKAKDQARRKAATATEVRTAISRKQVVATVQSHLAAGKTPGEAVDQAFTEHHVTRMTPALADAVARATGRKTALAATDGYIHDGRRQKRRRAGP